MAGKADIVDHVADNVEGITKKQAGEAFDEIINFITDSLADGDRVAISGFGTFTISERSERQGRNPKTGEPMTIPASKNARFKAGKQLKEAVNH